ncbi:hypothetical protein BGZ49_010009 [Haplosporangium sp. Z 27]|nr:hypothetical protein BGZ49_010009 [Haplosporangium sp. Z 27]
MFIQITHPLVLPELLLYVSFYVDPEDLFSCSLVCKGWHATFNKLLWKNISIDGQHGPQLMEALEAHSHYTNKLICKGDLSSDYLSVRYPNLETFKVLGLIGYSLWSSVADIISGSSMLTTISLSTIYPTILPDKIWDAIKDSASAKALRLGKIRIDIAQENSFWRACTILEKLELDSCSMIFDSWEEANISSRSLPISFPLIQEIKFINLESTDEYQKFLFLKRCPRLRSLTWDGTAFLIGQLSSDNPPGVSPLNLEELDLRGEASVWDINSFLKHNKKSLKKLAIPGFICLYSGFENVERHFLTLEELDFKNASVDSKVILKLLTSCPRLTSFKATVISASEIQRNETWACADQLSTLHIYFDLGHCNPEVASRRVFACLSKLTSLQELNLAWRKSYSTTAYLPFLEPATFRSQNDNSNPLRLQLNCGMDQLSTLWRMKRFYFGGYENTMTMEEGRWIKKHWRMLQMIQGVFNKDVELNAKIHRLFHKENKRFSRRQLME